MATYRDKMKEQHNPRTLSYLTHMKAPPLPFSWPHQSQRSLHEVWRCQKNKLKAHDYFVPLLKLFLLLLFLLACRTKDISCI